MTTHGPAHTPPHGLPFFVAHTPSRERPYLWHSLTDHLRAVAQSAEDFAEPFGGGPLARYVGLIHDVGKFDRKFQEYLLACDRAATAIPKQRPPRAGTAPHKQAGALLAWQEVPTVGRYIAQVIFGHHGGMVGQNDTFDKATVRQEDAALTLPAMRSLARACGSELDPVPAPLAQLVPAPHSSSISGVELFLRFVFSCLTDADGLDTERHKHPDLADRRALDAARTPTVAALWETLRADQERLLAKVAEDGSAEMPVNRTRRAVYDNCVHAAHTLPPGVFTLTVPTGGGKTRSALAFALRHAEQWGLRRVIYAAPFTSILDQTADVFEEIFGKERRVVLEHHSAVEPERRGEPENTDRPEEDDRELGRRLAAENWDAPLIVTTQVQLFESLFSNRPGKCRKLHRIARSVLILDEVQSLPPRLLAPLVDCLKLLVTNFGVTVVLCTATQPDLRAQMQYFQGFTPPPTEIVQAPETHFTTLRRVRYRAAFAEPWNWDRVASEMQDVSSLCVVNTRRQALTLMDLLDPDRRDPRVFHLSTLLCGRHRKNVITTIKKRLKASQPTILVATSVVEAGVDLDFPRLLRAVAPLPSLIQAAGRCNREGKRRPEDSEAILFLPEDDVTPADTVWKAARAQTLNCLNKALREQGGELHLDDPAWVTAWFHDFVQSMGNQTDAPDVRAAIAAFDFDVVARRARLIETDTVAVLPLEYAPEEAEAILHAAEEAGGMNRDLWRLAQPLCVSVPFTAASGLEERKYCPGLFLWPGKYDPKTGMPLESAPTEGGPVYITERLFA